MGLFDGKGFSKEPIEDDEAAKHRHLFHELDKSFVPLTKDQIAALSFGGVVAAVFRNWKAVGIIIAIVVLIGGQPFLDRLGEFLAGFVK